MDIINRKELLDFCETFINFLEGQKGKRAQFEENISSNHMNYDRHFTSTNRFAFIIEGAGIRFSGAIAMIRGVGNNMYEIDTMKMISGDIQGNTVTIIEKLDGQYTRRSAITILDS